MIGLVDCNNFFVSCERSIDRSLEGKAVVVMSNNDGCAIARSNEAKALGIKMGQPMFELRNLINSNQLIAISANHLLYHEISAIVHDIFHKYSPNVIDYSIDEAFLDMTGIPDIALYEIGRNIYDECRLKTGIPITIGFSFTKTLAKVATDLGKKHNKHIILLSDKKEINDILSKTNIGDIWGIGRKLTKRLYFSGIMSAKDFISKDINWINKEFGINATFLIDHAWGKEPTTIADIKRYKPKSNSLSNHQILFEDYKYEDAFLVVKEMVEVNVLDLVDRHLVTDHIALSIGYSKDVRKPTGGSRKMTTRTNSYRIIVQEFIELFEKTTDYRYPIRQIGISFGNIVDEMYESFDLFSDYEALEEERKLQQAIVGIKHKYGKNSILKGMNMLDKATTPTRNKLVGGHNAE